MSIPTEVRPTIFIVDDDAGMRAALQRLFRVPEFDEEVYASAQELLDQCQFRRPGLLLLDVMMPTMTGLELLETLRAKRINLPVIFLTASQSIPMAVEAMRRGAVEFLEKPFENSALVASVRLALQRAAEVPAVRLNRVEYERRRRLLTPREFEVMQHVVAGKTNKVMAGELGASHRTIAIHRTRVMAKMQASSLADLVRMVPEYSGH
jgi:two-component system, LuxR family, response regulator FixJ